MDIRPILSTLRGHKTAAALIVFEIALTCAILCNAVDLIRLRLQRLDHDSGWAVPELLVISVVGISRGANGHALTREDLGALRGVPGVKQVTTANMVPYGSTSWNTSVQMTPDQPRRSLGAAQYLGGDHFLETIGARVIAGRDFLPEEYFDDSDDDGIVEKGIPILVNRPMAERLFPQGEALGRILYQARQPMRIVGIVDALSDVRDLEPGHAALVMPARVAFSRGGRYLLRVDQARRAQVMAAAVEALRRVEPNRVILRQETLTEIRDRFFAPDRSMAGLLVAVCVALLIVTALGIVGLASFWVQQRTRMIGVRRALGASRGQIRGYFQTENFLLTSLGIVLGMAGAFGINQLLMNHYELPRLPWQVLPVGALALWALGQLAVLGPAMRAAALPPVVVMRGA